MKDIMLVKNSDVALAERDGANVMSPSDNVFLIEGPMRGDYSLAIVNREFSQALFNEGCEISCTSKNERVDDDPFMLAMPDVYGRYTSNPDLGSLFLHTLNTWPPTTDHLRGSFRALHCYAWEETEFPENFVRGFNQDLSFIAVTSLYTKVCLENSGVSVPIYVIGNGVDQILRLQTEPIPGLEQKAFRFLHISSCFARKGADALVDAFTAEFNKGENVELLIKTFDNIHNEIDSIVAEFQQRRPNAAPIRIVKAVFNPGQLKWLYENSSCLVAPSRGEGFLLPAAEAMLMDVPVITTGYSGQVDFCTPETAWLVKYRLEKSRTHMNLPGSLWAEPDVAHLRQQMRAVFNAPQHAIRQRTRVARQQVSSTYTWSAVAQRFLRALDDFRRNPPESRVHFSILSTWNQPCGIATYTDNIVRELEQAGMQVSILSHRLPNQTTVDQGDVTRVWEPTAEGLKRTCEAIARSPADLLLVQHHPGHYSWADLGKFIDAAVGAGRPVLVQFHSTRERQDLLAKIAPSLARCAALFVHTTEDVTLLHDMCPQARIVLLPHGVETGGEGLAPARQGGSDTFRIGAFGFMMPHKGFHELIAATALARRQVPNIELVLQSSITDDIKTLRYANSCHLLISHLNAGSYIHMDTRFLPMRDVFSNLADCDLLVFPYRDNNESASGAVRATLSLGIPLLVSPAKIFDSVVEFSHLSEGYDECSLARALVTLAKNPDLRNSHLEKQRQYVNQHSWVAISGRIMNIARITVQEAKSTRNYIHV